jgi:hypothetical protein
MPYENQYIGIFIYLLGIIAGGRNKNISDSINLLQQTPGDKAFNDLLLRWQGKNFIIEFKRNEKGLETEIKKPKRRQLIKEINEGNKALGHLSLKSHFVGYAIAKLEQSSLAFKRYISFNLPEEYPVDFQTFVTLLSDAQSQIGITDPKEFEDYLSYLIKVSGGDDVSGIVVNASSNGSFNFIVYNSYQELNQKIGLVKYKSLSQSIESENKNEKGKGINFSK